jgi:hypothetical protein
MPDKNDKPRKIIVDDDWKEQARREKEEADRRTRDIPAAERLPEPSFSEILQMIVLQASVTLGGVQDPQTGQRIPPNLPLAKHYIDLLEILEDKTRGNLDDNEKTVIERTLHDLRMAFVQVAGVGAQPSGPSQAPDQ